MPSKMSFNDLTLTFLVHSGKCSATLEGFLIRKHVPTNAAARSARSLARATTQRTHAMSERIDGRPRRFLPAVRPRFWFCPARAAITSVQRASERKKRGGGGGKKEWTLCQFAVCRRRRRRRRLPPRSATTSVVTANLRLTKGTGVACRKTVRDWI